MARSALAALATNTGTQLLEKVRGDHEDAQRLEHLCYGDLPPTSGGMPGFFYATHTWSGLLDLRQELGEDVGTQAGSSGRSRQVSSLWSWMQ